MGVFDTVKTMAMSARARGRARGEDLRLQRRRSNLLRQLGEAAYANAKGQSGSMADIDRLVDEIDRLTSLPTEEPVDSSTGDEPETSTDAADPLAD